MRNKLPFLNYTLALGGGIWLARSYAFFNLTTLAVLLIILSLAFFVSKYLKKPLQPLLQLVTANVFLFVSGYTSYTVLLPESNANDISQFTKVKYYSGVVESAQNYSSITNLKLKCTAVSDSLDWKLASGNVVVTIFNNTKEYFPGDIVSVKSNLAPIENELYINAFDKENFYGLQNIYFESRVKPSQVVCTGYSNVYIVRKWSKQTATFLEKIIDQYIPGSERGLAKALLLGNKNLIEKNLKQSYANAGVVHVLAVSGLHVATLFLILNFVFASWLKSIKYGTYFSTTIIIITLWSFAFITGLPPSVVRAVTMFSLLLVAQAGQRSTLNLNVVYASAFIMLLYNPMYLFDVGFQLSYAAVIGILWIYAWWSPVTANLKGWKKSVIDSILVTLAAQLITTPLCLLYFHQFPTYFIVANLFIVFAINIVMMLLLALIILCWIPFLGEFIGFAIEKILFACNYFVTFIDQLPYATVANINLDRNEIFILYGLLFSLLFLFYFRKKAYLYPLLGLSICWACHGLYATLKLQNHKEYLLIANKEPALRFVQEDVLYLYANDSLSKNQEDELSKYGIRKIVYHPEKINLEKVTFAENLAIWYTSFYKELQQQLTRTVYTKTLDAVILKSLNQKSSTLYWLNDNDKMPVSNFSEKLQMNYLQLKPNYIYSIPYLTL